LDLVVACITNAAEKFSPPTAPKLMPLFVEYVLHRRRCLQAAIDVY
jgi:hypothetical protein